MRTFIIIFVLGSIVAAAYSLQNNPSTALYTPFFSGGGGLPDRGDSADSVIKDVDAQSEKPPQSRISHGINTSLAIRSKSIKNSRIIKSPKNNHIINKKDRPGYKGFCRKK